MIDIPDNLLPQNEQGQSICPKCQNTVDACTCPSYEPAKPKQRSFTPIIQLDKKKRKGKLVTIIKDLPRDESYLKKLAKTLKAKTGSGGTFYIEGSSGVIEIQGNHIEEVKSLISKKSL